MIEILVSTAFWTFIVFWILRTRTATHIDTSRPPVSSRTGNCWVCGGWGVSTSCQYVAKAQFSYRAWIHDDREACYGLFRENDAARVLTEPMEIGEVFFTSKCPVCELPCATLLANQGNDRSDILCSAHKDRKHCYYEAQGSTPPKPVAPPTAPPVPTPPMLFQLPPPPRPRAFADPGIGRK
jgi:hypothetical protein